MSSWSRFLVLAPEEYADEHGTTAMTPLLYDEVGSDTEQGWARQFTRVGRLDEVWAANARGWSWEELAPELERLAWTSRRTVMVLWAQEGHRGWKVFRFLGDRLLEVTLPSGTGPVSGFEDYSVDVGESTDTETPKYQAGLEGVGRGRPDERSDGLGERLTVGSFSGQRRTHVVLSLGPREDVHPVPLTGGWDTVALNPDEAVVLAERLLDAAGACVDGEVRLQEIFRARQDRDRAHLAELRTWLDERRALYG